MPLYEFECIYGCGISEHLMPISMASQQYWTCPKCRNISQRVASLPANIQIGRPTIVFKDIRTGKAQIAISRFETPPPGFIKEEIKGSIERTKFENEQNKLASFEDEVYNTNREIERELLRKHIIDDANANMSADADKSDNPEATKHLMKKAIEHIQKKPKLRKRRKTEFRLDINHLDKSNLK